VLLLVITAATVTLHGSYATAEAACGDAPLVAATDEGAFCQRLGVWQVTLRDGDEWFIGPLPVQEGVQPERIEDGRVYFAQHAFRATGMDIDGEWMWPCRGRACLGNAVPLELHDHDLEIAADVIVDERGVDVVFTRLRILGEGTAEWRTLVEALRGHHSWQQ
jgi:hypothetical protein